MGVRSRRSPNASQKSSIFLRRVRRCRKPVCRAHGKIFLHTFVSDGRLLAIGKKIIRISSETTGPQAPKEDPFLAFFGPSAPLGDSFVSYIGFLPPAYNRADLGL